MVPAVMLLNAGPTISSFFGASAALIIGAVLALALWMLVWMRLYGMGSRSALRPEFAILAVVPQMVFYGLNVMDPAYAEPYLGAPYQTFYLLLWLAGLWVCLVSLTPSPNEEPQPLGRDAVRLVVSAFLIFSTLSGWSYCTAMLFPSLLNG